MLATIIRNLLSNAIKFTPDHGHIQILINSLNSNFEISITDDGVGIDPVRQKHIFEIDNNKTTQGTRREKGTGLGLILCAEFANRMGGQLTVESQLGKGSTFKFTLPGKTPTLFVHPTK